MSVSYRPAGYHTVCPYLVVPSVEQLLEFVTKAFGAVQQECLERPDTGVMHAAVKIGDSMIMMGKSNAQWPPIPAMIHLYVPDVDRAYEQALAAGAAPVMAVAEQFYGDRSGGVRDSQGNYWWLATHIEDVPHDELVRRAAAFG